MKLAHYSFFLIFLLHLTLCFSQEDSLVQQNFEYDKTQNLQPVLLDESKIEDFKNDGDFNFTEVKTEENWWYKFKRWIGNIWDNFWTWLLGDYKANTFLALLIKNLPYIILFLTLCFIVYLFIKINPAGSYKNNKENAEVFLSEEEKIIYSEDIQKLIQEALQKKQFRLAIRYSYLLILKNLKDKKLIDYQFQKTNHDYLAEIEPATLNLKFEKITRVYDFVWYGDFPITEKEYQIAEKEFSAFQKELI